MIDISHRDGLKPFLRRWPVWGLRTLLIATCILLLPVCLIRGAWAGILDLWDGLSGHWRDFGCIKQNDKKGGDHERA